MTVVQADFYIKRGDRLPTLARQLKWQDETPIDLTGCTVTWKMVDKKTRAVKVNAAATIVSAAEGRVEYDWQVVDTNAAGHFEGEWQITYPDARRLTVPNMNFVTVHVVDSLV